jgi:hypothetical protein
LQEERRLREEMAARMEAEREAERQKMGQMFQYMQSLSAAMGQPLPPLLFPPPPPPEGTPVSMNVIAFTYAFLV